MFIVPFVLLKTIEQNHLIQFKSIYDIFQTKNICMFIIIYKILFPSNNGGRLIHQETNNSRELVLYEILIKIQRLKKIYLYIN